MLHNDDVLPTLPIEFVIHLAIHLPLEIKGGAHQAHYYILECVVFIEYVLCIDPREYIFVTLSY
jgi:hypothetical protein